MKRWPPRRTRVLFAICVLAVSVGWLLRPMDRSVLIPVRFSNGIMGYINRQGRSLKANNSSSATADQKAEKRSNRHDFRDEADDGYSSAVRGYADESGKLYDPIDWSEVPNDVELVPVRKGPFWGYMNRAGQWVVEPKYSNAEPFYPSGWARVWDFTKRGAINRQGRFIATVTWSHVCRPRDIPIIVVGGDAGTGAFNLEGREIVPAHYSHVDLEAEQGFEYVIANGPIKRVGWKKKLITWIERYTPIRLDGNTKSPRMDVYDLHGRRIWSSHWWFSSWACVWILAALGWLLCELIIFLKRRGRNNVVVE